jgi:hypothetical protein
MVDYTDALVGATQEALDNCDPTFTACRSGTYAFVKIGRMHGVSVAFEDRHDANGELPALIRDGVVLRFLIPRGTHLEDLASGLGQGGHLATLIDEILDGHILTLTADSAKGRLTPAAALARDDLLDAIGSFGPLWEPGGDMMPVMVHDAARLSVCWSMPEPEGVC